VSEAVAVAKVSFGRPCSMMSSSSETDIPMSKSSSPPRPWRRLNGPLGNLWIETVERVQTHFSGVSPHRSPDQEVRLALIIMEFEFRELLHSVLLVGA